MTKAMIALLRAMNQGKWEQAGYGRFFTSMYLTVVALLAGIYKSDYVWTMGLNEWGDFLAGIFAPVAFLWLVLGYFIQAKELRAQVEGTRELAGHAKTQAVIAERELEHILAGGDTFIEPKFSYLGGNPRETAKNRRSYYFRNEGSEARSVQALIVSQEGKPIPTDSIDVTPRPVCAARETITVTISTGDSGTLNFPMMFIIACSDQKRDQHVSIVDVAENGEVHNVRHVPISQLSRAQNPKS